MPQQAVCTCAVPDVLQTGTTYSGDNALGNAEGVSTQGIAGNQY